MANIRKLVNENKYLVGGTAGGFLMGAGLSALQVLEGSLQLAFFPVHMAVRTTQAVCEPVVRIVSPLVIMPIYTGLGALCGIGAQSAIGDQSDVRSDVADLEEKLEAEIEAAEDRDRKLDEVLQSATNTGYNL